MADNEQNGPSMSNAVRKLVEAHGLDPSAIEATGKDGRLLKADVEAYIAGQNGDTSGSGEPGTVDSDPLVVRIPETTHLRMLIGNAEQMVQFAEGEIVRESHKIKALIAAGKVKAEDFVK